MFQLWFYGGYYIPEQLANKTRSTTFYPIPLVLENEQYSQPRNHYQIKHDTADQELSMFFFSVFWNRKREWTRDASFSGQLRKFPEDIVYFIRRPILPTLSLQCNPGQTSVTLGAPEIKLSLPLFQTEQNGVR